MFRRLWPFVHAALTLAALAGCGYLLWLPRAPVPTGRLSDDADIDLRKMLQIRWIGGDYELPPGDDHCAVGLLLFTDGKLVESMCRMPWSVGPDASRVVPYAFLWSTAPGGPRPMLRTGFGAWRRGFGPTDVCAELSGPLTQARGPVQCDELRGYRVIGLAASEGMRAGQERNNNSSGLDAADKLAKRKHVLVLGLKVFPTAEEAERYANGPGDSPDP